MVSSFLELRITECYLNINCKKQLIENIVKELQTILSPEHWTVLLQYNAQIQDRLRQNIKKSQLAKLEKLRCFMQKTSEAPHKSRWVNNLSNKELTTSLHHVLEKGLNFAPLTFDNYYSIFLKFSRCHTYLLLLLLINL